jgi:hypothetical protein
MLQDDVVPMLLLDIKSVKPQSLPLVIQSGDVRFMIFCGGLHAGLTLMEATTAQDWFYVRYLMLPLKVDL